MKKGKAKPKVPPLEAGLLQAMKALDNQIARQMQRSPAEREELGVQKWEPIGERIEEVVSLVLEKLGSEEVALDGLLVLSQAMSKALYLLVEELGEEGLGELRGGYCRKACELILRDAERAMEVLVPEGSHLN